MEPVTTLITIRAMMELYETAKRANQASFVPGVNNQQCGDLAVEILNRSKDMSVADKLELGTVLAGNHRGAINDEMKLKAWNTFTGQLANEVAQDRNLVDVCKLDMLRPFLQQNEAKPAQPAPAPSSPRAPGGPVPGFDGG